MKNGVKNIQTAGNNGAHMVVLFELQYSLRSVIFDYSLSRFKKKILGFKAKIL
jgi:hypothetical protein